MQERMLLDSFTIPARLVILGGLLLAIGGTWAYVVWLNDRLPPGARYPLFLAAVPICLGSAAIVGLGLKVLQWCGVAIRAQPPRIDAEER
jgi:hypothetical protein